MKTGRNIFWAGFIIALGVIIGYLVAMILGIELFGGWITSLSSCGIIMAGSLMMLIGKAIERRNGRLD